MSTASAAIDTRESQAIQGWRVTLAAFGINLALGVLYTWSVISKGVPEQWGWQEADKSLPYAVACLVFSLVMVPAGRMQDKYGPRLVATLGGVLVGVGMILASFTTSPWGYVVGFGLMAGAGIGFAYASATPPAVKWFPPAKTGLIAGLVVSGFGLASVYTAPLSQWLIGTFSLATAMATLGVAFLVIVVGLSQLLKTPPQGYVAPGALAVANSTGPQKKNEYLPLEMLRTWQFYALWLMYAFAAGAGLMIISKLTKIADVQAGINMGFWFVVALAIGNGAGRVAAGVVSDKIGRKATMFICFVMQAVLIVVLTQINKESPLANIGVLAVISALVGANYGANLTLFPSATIDYYGKRNFGMDYGLVFTAWGVGGFMLSLLAGKVYDKTESFNFAYITSASLLVVAAIATFLLRPPHHVEE